MLVFLIIFLAIFVQTVTGFGLALVSMPLLVHVVGIRVATPLMALVGGVAEALLLRRYRADFSLRAVARLTLASLIGVPPGILLLRHVDAELITAVLGLLTMGYALYSLSGLTPPQLRRPAWAYGFGFLGGLLGGAYNISGPPVIIYGSCRRWSPAQFKSNLQGYFLINSVLVTAGHAVGGGYTAVVWRYFLIGLPAVALAVLLGARLDQRLNPVRFRQLVLILLLLLGGSLLLG